MPSIEDVKAVTSIMCDVTRDILWVPLRDWALQRKPGFDVEIVPGTGKRTYHRGASDGEPAKIVYGQKMVEDKMSNNLRACGWLSAKEIVQRGYYSGVQEPAELLAHTICHEFGHLVQVILGRRTEGSVHNDEFYEILDKMHENGHAQRVLDELRRRTAEKGLKLTFDQTFAERKFSVFESFPLQAQGQTYQATVMKVTGKTQKVKLRLEAPYKAPQVVTMTQLQLNRMLIAA